MAGIERKKLRIRGSKPLWGVEGIRLKNVKEYDKDQDSDVSNAVKHSKEKEQPWRMPNS